MTVTLSNDDRCVVDLLLGRADAAACFSAAPSDFHQRLNRVEQLLRCFDAYTVSDPPADLLARTLARCDDADRRRPAHVAPTPAITVPARTPA